MYPAGVEHATVWEPIAIFAPDTVVVPIAEPSKVAGTLRELPAWSVATTVKVPYGKAVLVAEVVEDVDAELDDEEAVEELELADVELEEEDDPPAFNEQVLSTGLKVYPEGHGFWLAAYPIPPRPVSMTSSPVRNSALPSILLRWHRVEYLGLIESFVSGLLPHGGQLIDLW